VVGLFVVLLEVPGAALGPGVAPPVVPLVGALLLGALLLGVVPVVPEPGVLEPDVDPGVVVPVVPLLVPVPPVMPLDPGPLPLMLVEPVPVFPALPLREPLIVLPLIEAVPVLSTPSADKVAASVALPPVMPWACLKLRKAARVFGPILPSTAPGF